MRTTSATTLTPLARRAGRVTGRRLAAVSAAIVTTLGALLAADPAAQAMPHHAAGVCVRHDTTAALTTDPGATRYRIAGWLCTPRQPTRTVQLLLSGYTYSHTYWTTPEPRNDWATAATASGQAVYMIDRIGVGASDRAPGDQITADSEATVTHQIVTALRDGTLGRYRTVVGVGHSYGSIVWMAEAASYHDVNALVLTGMLHQLSTDQLTAFVGALQPAAADPKFAGQDLPDGYLTTKPGTRAGFFLDPQTAIPGAAGWDEASKATGTTGELTFTTATETADSLKIRVPVLALVGAEDALLCTADLPCATGAELCQRERPTYPAQTPLSAVSIPRTGHSINLHRAGPRAAAIANRWITHPYARDAAVTACTP